MQHTDLDPFSKIIYYYISILAFFQSINNFGAPLRSSCFCRLSPPHRGSWPLNVPKLRLVVIAPLGAMGALKCKF